MHYRDGSHTSSAKSPMKKVLNLCKVTDRVLDVLCGAGSTLVVSTPDQDGQKANKNVKCLMYYMKHTVTMNMTSWFKYSCKSNTSYTE